MFLRTTKRAKGLAALTGCALLFGCGEAESPYDANVQGTVTIDGELAPGGSVTFTPVEEGPTAVGAIASDGSYALRIGQGEVGDPDSSMIPSGKYVVTAMITGPPPKSETSVVRPPPAGPRLIADKYATRSSTDLNFKVEKGPNVIVLKLDGPWANPPAEETENDANLESPEEASATTPAHAVDGEEATPASDAVEDVKGNSSAPAAVEEQKP